MCVIRQWCGSFLGDHAKVGEGRGLCGGPGGRNGQVEKVEW